MANNVNLFSVGSTKGVSVSSKTSLTNTAVKSTASRVASSSKLKSDQTFTSQLDQAQSKVDSQGSYSNNHFKDSALSNSNQVQSQDQSVKGKDAKTMQDNGQADDKSVDTTSATVQDATAQADQGKAEKLNQPESSNKVQDMGEAGNQQTNEAGENIAAQLQGSLNVQQINTSQATNLATLDDVQLQSVQLVDSVGFVQPTSVEALLAGQPQQVNTSLQQTLATISSDIMQQPVKAVQSIAGAEQLTDVETKAQNQIQLSDDNPLAMLDVDTPMVTEQFQSNSIEALLTPVQENAQAGTDQSMLAMLGGRQIFAQPARNTVSSTVGNLASAMDENISQSSVLTENAENSVIGQAFAENAVNSMDSQPLANIADNQQGNISAINQSQQSMNIADLQQAHPVVDANNQTVGVQGMNEAISQVQNSEQIVAEIPQLQTTVVELLTQVDVRNPGVDAANAKESVTSNEMTPSSVVNDLLGDAPVVVETNNASASSEDSLFQQFANENQQNAQQQILNARGEAQAAQLPEEAAFDAAPIDSSSADVSSVGAATFQQQLGNIDDSLNAQQVQQPQHMNQSLEAYDIPKQIVEQARLIRSAQNSEMVIKLNPEHLGDLTLKVAVNSNSGVTATFHSDNAQVRGLLETSMIQLKQELNEQGIKVDNIQVSAGLPDGQMPQDMGQGYYAQQGQANQQNTNTRSSLNAYEGDGTEADGAGMVDGVPVNQSTEPIRDSQGNVISDGVDYRI